VQPLMTAPERGEQAVKRKGGQGPLEGQSADLWSRAPAFRRLVLSAGMVTAAAASLQLVPSPRPEATLQQAFIVNAPSPVSQPTPATQPATASAVPAAVPSQAQIAKPVVKSVVAQQKPKDLAASQMEPIAVHEKKVEAHRVLHHRAELRVPPAEALEPRARSSPVPAPTPQVQEQTAILSPVPQERSQSIPAAPVPSQIPSRDCGPDARYNSLPSAGGVVVGFLTPEQAQWLLLSTQSARGMSVNPEYLANKRALVRIGGGSTGPQVVALVPWGMDVKVGDHVHYAGLHVDPTVACQYIPNLIDSGS